MFSHKKSSQTTYDPFYTQKGSVKLPF